MERALSDAKKQLALGGGADAGPAVKDVNGTKFMGQVLDGVSPKDLRATADAAKKKIGSGVIALVAVNDGKAAVLVGVTDDLTGTYNAQDLVRAGVEAVGGKGGGGRPDMAQGGGPEGGKAEAALKAVEEALAS